MAGQPFTDIGVFVGAIVVQDRMDGLVVRHLTLDLVEKTEEFLMAVTGGIVADNGASQHTLRGKEGRGAMALVVMLGPRPFFRGRPGFQGRLGCVRSSACICDGSSMDSTTAWAGGDT